MDRDELITLGAERALKELSWEDIEWFFKPRTVFELLLRLDFEGTQKMFLEWITDDSPDAMPFRYHGDIALQVQPMIDLEAFYRKIKELREKEDERQFKD